MAATFIHSSDILDFDPIPNPQSTSSAFSKPGISDYMTRSHPQAGDLKFKSMLFSHMHVMSLHWESKEDVVLYDNTPVDTININFHISGQLHTTFEGLSHDLRMTPKRHNLVFCPQGGDINRVAAHDSLEMFHISLDKMYFADIIGCDDHWSERVQQNLLYDRPFSGITGTLGFTPHMERLIGEVKQMSGAGAMRNLMVQSKILELLALQIEQFRGPEKPVNTFSLGDIEKLHFLKAFLDKHFLEDYSLAELSRICLLNEFKVKKGFKELFETTVFGHLRKLRMDYAERMLLDSSRSVEEVSDMLGYEHAHHFSTAFKKFRGINPSSIKSQYLKYQ